jgi:hypothetical protein
MDLEDHVRFLEEQGFMLTISSRYERVHLASVKRRKYRFELVPQHCWDDDQIQRGYKALWAAQGFQVIQQSSPAWI